MSGAPPEGAGGGGAGVRTGVGAGDGVGGRVGSGVGARVGVGLGVGDGVGVGVGDSVAEGWLELGVGSVSSTAAEQATRITTATARMTWAAERRGAIDLAAFYPAHERLGRSRQWLGAVPATRVWAAPQRLRALQRCEPSAGAARSEGLNRTGPRKLSGRPFRLRRWPTHVHAARGEPPIR